MIGPRPEVEALLRKYRAQLMAQAAANGAANTELFRLVESLERLIMRRLEQYMKGEITKRKVSQVSKIASRAAVESDRDVAAWLHKYGPSAAMNGNRMQATILRASLGRNWQGAPYERVKNAFDTWEAGIQSGKLFDFAKGQSFVEYTDTWDRQWIATARSLQERFVEAAINGESWKDLAKANVEGLDALGLQNRMNKYAFSEAYTRTELTRISNNAAIGMAADAGIDTFINDGVPDDRQSEECAEADTLGAMTLAEWDASGPGRPPRHVFNCRCTLLAQPSEAWITGSKEPMEATA